VYTWILSIEKKLLQDLEKMWVKAFDSKWDLINIDKHEVMTQIPWEDWIILDEFEKWYMIGDRVLRVAKVVVGQS
jgi:molecular chaperone GrpE (heat shock protein)